MLGMRPGLWPCIIVLAVRAGNEAGASWESAWSKLGMKLEQVGMRLEKAGNEARVSWEL